MWGGDLHCAIIIGVVSGSGVSKYEGGINTIHKFGGWRGDGIRNCRLTVASVGSVGDELLWMEIVKRISCQLVNVEELARWGVRRAKPFVGVRRSGCAAGSGELIVDPPIVHPTPVTVFNKQQSRITLFQ